MLPLILTVLNWDYTVVPPIIVPVKELLVQGGTSQDVFYVLRFLTDGKPCAALYGVGFRAYKFMCGEKARPPSAA